MELETFPSDDPSDPDEPVVDPLEAATEERRRRAVPLLVGGFLLVFLAILVSGWITSGGSDGPDVALEGTWVDLDGQPVDLATWRGTPVVVNFFASWCVPCRAEMPDFEAVNQAMAGEVRFVGLNVSETDTEAARELVADTGVTYTIGFDGPEEFLEDVGGFGMPTTALFDADGDLVAAHTGVLDAEELQDMIDEEFGS